MPQIRYKCLILDHDDTTVNSTEEVNYPAFLHTLSLLRPDYRVSYEDFMNYCFEPGFFDYCTKIIGFNEDEMKIEYSNWKEFVAKITPTACAGFDRLIERYRAAGGIICTVSQSESDNIIRDWRANFNTEPDAVYGWDMGEGKRKPDPFPVLDIARRFSLDPADILVVDDLRTGYDMARRAGAAFAGALWAQPSPLIRGFMKNNADCACADVPTLERYLFNE